MIGRIAGVIRGLIPSGSVLEQTVKSGVWMSIIKLSGRLLQILMLIILARLLSPRVFGLVGIALICLEATKKVTQIGLDAALIQHTHDDVDGYLDTCWSLEILRGLLIVVILFVAAPYIAAFFGEPRTVTFIRVIALGPFFVSFRNPAVVYFRKDLQFHREFVYLVSGSLVQFLVGVGYALASPTAWALVFAYLAGDATRSLLSYVIDEYRPSLSLDPTAAAELVDYGKWITASAIVHFIYHNGDDAFVGWFLSATALGFYQYAYRIADVPSTELGEIISNVTFPAYSKLQEQPGRLREALLSTTRLTAALTIPMALGIALIAPSFVPVVLGPDWVPMVTVMQLLAVYGLIHGITKNFASIWKALGRPDYLAKLGFLRVVSLAILIWPATARWGIEGAAGAAILSYLVPGFPLEIYATASLTQATSFQIYREYLYPMIGGTVMFGVLWYMRGVLALPPLLELLFLIPAGMILYGATVILLERQFAWGIGKDYAAIVGSLRG